jgi:hypothetical protein
VVFAGVFTTAMEVFPGVSIFLVLPSPKNIETRTFDDVGQIPILIIVLPNGRK